MRWLGFGRSDSPHVPGVQAIPVRKIGPSPFPRLRPVDAASLERLKRSIRAHGVLVPIVVRAVGDRYEIAGGEGRLRACRELGFRTIPAMVRRLDDREMAEISGWATAAPPSEHPRAGLAASL